MEDILKKHGKLLTLVLAAVVVAMLFLPANTIELLGKTSSVNGLDSAFGISDGGVFSIVLTLGYLLPIAAVVVCRFLFNNGKLQYLILFVAFLASAIILFMAPDFTNIEVIVSVTAKDLGYKLGMGAIIGGVASALGALVSVGCLTSKKVKK